MNYQFKDKKFLVTGGTSGIGLATVKMIRENGGHVIATGTSDDHIEETREHVCENCLVLKSDSSNTNDISELARKAKDHFGELDGVFLNAGFGKFTPTQEINESHVDEMLNVNVKGVALQMAKLQPLIKKGGSVLITSSVAPYLGMAEGAVYAATKGAATAMMRSFATDLAKDNIRVNAICPGPIETRFFKSDESNENDNEEMKKEIQNSVPLSRFGKADEVASVACFLMSDASSYVTGSEYMVDGGMSLR